MLPRFPHRGRDRDDRRQRDDHGEFPVELNRPQDHRVRLEQVERVKGLVKEQVEDGRDADLDQVLAIVLKSIRYGHSIEAFSLALVKVALFHTLVHIFELDESAFDVVPHVLDLLVDEEAPLTRTRRHVLFENLLEFVLQQNFFGRPERRFAIETVELDVGSPRDKDEDEAAGGQRD